MTWHVGIQIGERSVSKTFESLDDLRAAVRGTVVPLLPEADRPRALQRLLLPFDLGICLAMKGVDWHVMIQQLPEGV